ncbi:hypothetical protein OIU79_002828, partial [Salix purpurea]
MKFSYCIVFCFSILTSFNLLIQSLKLGVEFELKF